MPLTDVRIRSLEPADNPHKYSDGAGFSFIFMKSNSSPKNIQLHFRFTNLILMGISTEFIKSIGTLQLLIL